MKVTATAIPDVLILEPRVFEDNRGFFFESYNQKRFDDAVGRNVHFLQDNHSRSVRHVLRGLHYQIHQPQGKLVHVIAGEVFDVAVDLRRSSPTFGKFVSMVLSAANKKQLWIPEGFAHGFFVLQRSGGISLQDHRLLLAARRTLRDLERSRDRNRLAEGRQTDPVREGPRWGFRSAKPRFLHEAARHGRKRSGRMGT